MRLQPPKLGLGQARAIVQRVHRGDQRGLRLGPAAGVSPTVLQARLDELREAALVELAPRQGYALTALGRELLAAFAPLYRFSARWASVTAPRRAP